MYFAIIIIASLSDNDRIMSRLNSNIITLCAGVTPLGGKLLGVVKVWALYVVLNNCS